MDGDPSTEGKEANAPAGKIRITPRTAAVPTHAQPPEQPEEQLHLEPAGPNPAWERMTRAEHKNPKAPFELPSKKIEGQVPAGLPHHPHSRHGMLAFFRSRRRGQARVWNFVILPLLVVIVAAAIFALFKFL